MSTKKIQILNTLISEAANADTLDGKHAEDFVDKETFHTLVGDEPVADKILEQISDAVENVAYINVEDNEDVINPETGEYALKSELNTLSDTVATLSEQIADKSRKYVEEFKTEANTWNDAFEELFAWCLQKNAETSSNGARVYNYTACTGGAYYSLTRPLIIGDLDIDFENAELFNNIAESDANQACVILTGAENRIQKFGYVAGRQSVGILINSTTGRYGWNKLYVKRLWGYNHALQIAPVNSVCYFSEFHILNMASAYIPLRVYSESQLTNWANELYFYIAHFSPYRDIKPTKLIEMTNVTKCNVYNADLECIVDNTKEDACAVELTNCSDVAFYNPRTKEPYNAVQFRFIGECFDNYIDAEYSKAGTIDSSQMHHCDALYNVWRGRVATGNAGSGTNVKHIRIYSNNMIVPEQITPFVRKVENDITISGELLWIEHNVADNAGVGGVPTLIEWVSGDIVLDKRFIALCPEKIHIIKVADTVGDIIDLNGKTIISGSELTMNKRYDIGVLSHSLDFTEPIGEFERQYMTMNNIRLFVGDVFEPDITTISHEFINGFVRPNGTQNTTVDACTYTGLVKYMGGSVDFRAVAESAAQNVSVVAFFDENQTFLGNIETALGGHSTFYETYNTKEYETLNGKSVGADVVGGTLTAEQINAWYPNTKYIAVSSSVSLSAVVIAVVGAIANPHSAQQTY